MQSEELIEKIMYEVTPEEEENMIEKAAGIIIRSGMEMPAVLFLETLKPLSFIAGELSRIYMAPLVMFLGSSADRFISIFEKKKNIDKLLDRVEELRNEMDEKKKKAKEERKRLRGETGKKDLRTRIKEAFSRKR